MAMNKVINYFVASMKLHKGATLKWADLHSIVYSRVSESINQVAKSRSIILSCSIIATITCVCIDLAFK